MRNGDSYKIKSMAGQGVSEAEICQHFRNKYDPAEVKRFIPAKASKPEPTLSDSDSPKPKRKARKRSTAKG